MKMEIEVVLLQAFITNVYYLFWTFFLKIELGIVLKCE